MNIDLPHAALFMATHARLLDRRRFDLLIGPEEPEAAIHALNAYRNPDGGYGALEPDLRSSESQPVAAMHAFEVLAEIAPTTLPQATELCNWLASASLGDGGLPSALAVENPAGCAPFWAQANPAVSSLQITTAVTSAALRVARHDHRVAQHPWLKRATQYCIDEIRVIKQQPQAYELMFCLRFLDELHDKQPDTAALLDRMGGFVPADGVLHVTGGLEEEVMRPLDIAPEPNRPVRRLFTDRSIAEELDRLAAMQQEDGGWPLEFAAYSPAAALEWRGYLTVRVLSILKANVPAAASVMLGAATRRT